MIMINSKVRKIQFVNQIREHTRRQSPCILYIHSTKTAPYQINLSFSPCGCEVDESEKADLLKIFPKDKKSYANASCVSFICNIQVWTVDYRKWERQKKTWYRNSTDTHKAKNMKQKCTSKMTLIHTLMYCNFERKCQF